MDNRIKVKDCDSSGFLMGPRVKVQASTMEVNGCLKMIPISKSIGHLDDGLDLGVKPLTDSIGDSMLKVRKHILKVAMERSSCLDDGLQSRMGCPEVPPLEMSRSPSFPGIVPEIPKTLFNRPGPSGFQVAGLQPLKALPVLLPYSGNSRRRQGAAADFHRMRRCTWDAGRV